MTTTLIITGILLLPAMYNVLFPFKRPVLDNYFRPGQRFISEAEGVTQTIIRQDGDKVYCELSFAPYAIGPTEHLHQHTDESATLVKGSLTTRIDGKIGQLQAGERLILKKGSYHQMFNETDEEVILRAEKEEDFLPIELAYSLAQIYPLMSPDGGLNLRMFAKICVLDELFDTVPLGPPPAFFAVIKKSVKPYARLFGVTPYDSCSKPR